MNNKKTNIRVVSFPINQYDKNWLDTLTDEQLSETACAEGQSEILTLAEFQEKLNDDVFGIDTENNWWYFLTD